MIVLYDATYVGQTKRQLKTKVQEHRSDIKKKSGSFQLSLIIKSQLIMNLIEMFRS